MMPLLLRAAALVALGVTAGLALNNWRGDSVSVAHYAAPVACAAAAAMPPPRVVVPADAVSMCADPSVLIADVRSAAQFAEGHVAGAIHLPCGAERDAVGGALQRLGHKRTFLVYGETTDEAVAVADALASRISARPPNPGAPPPALVVLDGGFAAWNAAGLACSSGPCPDCQVSPEDP